MIRYDVIISPIDSPLEQLTIEVDAIGAKTAEKFAEECFKDFRILCISAHNERKLRKMTVWEKLRQIFLKG